MARVESSASLNNNLRDVCDNDFRFPPIPGNLSRHSHGFALVLLRIREVPGAGGWNKGGDDLIRVLAAQVQENVASPGLVNAVHLVCDRCYFADVFSRFGSGVDCRGLRDLGQIFNLFPKLGSSISVEEL